MSPQASTSKRPATEPSTPPPPKKLASIFAPAARRPWTEKDLVKGKCWHGVWGDPTGSEKVLALDLDGTVIVPASGAKFPKEATDWKWAFGPVAAKLKAAHASGYAIVFISNQAGNPAQQRKFREKLPLVGAKLGESVPFHVFAAWSKEAEYRKPGTGMWDAYVREFNDGKEVDLSQSYYIGDAAGRSSDHSDSDRKMADNAGLLFQTPEEYFLDKPVSTAWSYRGFDPKTYDHSLPLFSPTPSPLVPTRSSEFAPPPPPEVVLFVGPPGAGKTSIYRRFFEPAGYVHVNQDTLKSRDKCLKAVEAALASTPSRSVVVDNTSPACSTRAEYLEVIRRVSPRTPVRVLYFATPLAVCMHNALYRSVHRKDEGRDALPLVAFQSYEKALEVPQESEGFKIVTINFKFEGTDEQRKLWNRWIGDSPKPAKASMAGKGGKR